MCFVRKFWLVIFQVFFLTSVLVGGFTSCTTSDTEDGFEDELNAELDDMDGESLDDAEVAEDDGTDATDEAEGDITADADDDFSDENFDEKSQASQTADASEDDGDTDKPDDEFAAEDAGNPIATADAGASGDDLAEQDLAKELDKGTEKTAATGGQEQPNQQIVPYPDEPTSAENNIPEGLKASADEPVITPAGDGATAAAPDATTAPNSAGVAMGTITSKDAGISNDPFEQITSGPSVPTEDIGSADPLVAEVDPPLPAEKAAKEIVPVAKVEKDPFYKNERLMNTVYIARPGDDLGTISQKIFNEDRKAALLEDNPHVTKGVEPGDKIYYNSPNRPDDRKAVLSYYEDNKMAPLYYITKKGDDIQKIGRSVLGFEDAWKEVWAENESLQTQALLPAGLKIRYWTGNEMKMASEPPTPAATEPPPQQVASVKEEVPIDLPPAEPAALPAEDPGLRLNDPTPLPSDTFVSAPAIDSADKDSNLMTMAGGAIAALAILALVAIQIKNRKRENPGMPPSLDFNKV
jgi:hypothetical protein